MAEDDRDLETNDELDAAAEALWLIPDERQREAALTINYVPFVTRCVNAAVGDNPNLERDDAMQEALIRLLHCIRKFDPTRGARFTTYATGPVTFGTLDAARNEDWVPAKARAADREEQRLPVMFAMDPALDADGEDDQLKEIQFDLAEMLEAVKGTHVERAINHALRCLWDYELMGIEWECSTAHATFTVKEAWKELRDIEAYKRKVAEQQSLPAYQPPPPDAAMIQAVMFAEEAA